VPLLQRYLPFWFANLVDRMWPVLVSIVAVLMPLSRVLPPLYEFRVRSRIFRWYEPTARTGRHDRRAKPSAQWLAELAALESARRAHHRAAGLHRRAVCAAQPHRTRALALAQAQASHPGTLAGIVAGVCSGTHPKPTLRGMDTRSSTIRPRIESVREELAPTRACRRAGALLRSAPVRIPAGTLAGTAVAFGLHRVDGHAGGHAETAVLFADSRYWVQAEAELAGSGVELFRIPTGAATHHDRLAGQPRRRARRSEWTGTCSAWPPHSNCCSAR
jgi:hypothetical protein